jgi:DNA-binding transcriptional LysR family regulator
MMKLIGAIMDRLQTIRVLLRVVDEGSFAAAARALDISPANVTRMISDLEAHLSVRLLQRTTRRLALTDAGKGYVQQMRSLLGEMDELEAGLIQSTSKVQGTLKLFASTVLSSQMLAPALAGFCQLYPEVRVDIHADTDNALPLEDYDLSFFVGREGFNADIVARELMKDPLHLYASPAYLKRAAPLRKVEDLAQHALLKLHILNGPPHWTLSCDEAATGKAKTDATHRITQRAAIMSNHVESMLRLVVEGAGITTVSSVLAAPYVASGELQRVLPQWQAGMITIYAALPSRKYVPAHVRALLGFMEQYRTRMTSSRVR